MDIVEQLRKLQQRRCLMSFRREGIASWSLQAIVLAVSEKLVAFQYVSDFTLDGIMVIAMADITEVRQNKTDRFQHKLLKIEGALEHVPFDLPIALGSWSSAIDSLSEQRRRIIIVETERAPNPGLWIGKVLDTTSTAVRVQHFTGIARWEDKPQAIPLSNITCCQVDTHYIRAYERHFAREIQKSGGVT